MATKSAGIGAFQSSSEAELLLCCARTVMQPETGQRVKQVLKEKIDWHYLTQEAFYHGTIPLLFWNLSRLCPDAVPKTILNQLKDSCIAIARWNLSLTGELLKLLNLFRDRGIRALPFKGPVLAATAYGNLSLRHFGDLDILMPRENILKAKEVLPGQGFRPVFQLTRSKETAYMRSHHEYKFVRSTDGMLIELQWAVTQQCFSFAIDFDDVWQRREEVSLGGVAVLNVSIEDLMLVLCVHGAKHSWRQLKWICDIAELVASYRERIDWHQLVGQARTLGGERMLLLGLFLAHDLLGAALPGEALRNIHQDPQVKHLARQVSERLFRNAFHPAKLRDEYPFFYCRVRERSRDKLAVMAKYFPEYFLRAVTPNKRDRAFLQLPTFLAMGYYLIRPVRLFLECWFDFLQRFRGIMK